MKNQLLILALLVFACDTTGRSSVSSNVVYEKYVLDCNDPESTVEIDISDYPVITYYVIEFDQIKIGGSLNELESMIAYTSDSRATLSCSSPIDREYIFSLVRKN